MASKKCWSLNIVEIQLLFTPAMCTWGKDFWIYIDNSTIYFFETVFTYISEYSPFFHFILCFGWVFVYWISLRNLSTLNRVGTCYLNREKRKKKFKPTSTSFGVIYFVSLFFLVYILYCSKVDATVVCIRLRYFSSSVYYSTFIEFDRWNALYNFNVFCMCIVYMCVYVWCALF